MKRVVVVGASLAGLRAAESVRRAGHEGEIFLVGAEKHHPYDRPPLSKQVLTGAVQPEATALVADDDLAAEWMLGRRALHLDPDRRRLTLDGDDELDYDGLVIATGARPRRLPGLAQLDGVHVLRTLDDAVSLRTDLEASPRVAVIGGGFIGAEVASSCRQRGLDVTVIEALPVPLAGALGEDMGRACAALHSSGGTTLLTGTAVDGLVGGDRVEGVRLADGRTVDADVVVVGVGVAPEVEWLEGSGVDVDNGVRCDPWCRVRVHGRPRPDVVACGDVARWEHPGWGDEVRIEHWTNAVEHGEAAGASLVRGEEADPYAPVPYFWSDQYKVKIQMVGHPRPGDEVKVIDGSVDDGKFVAAYGREGRLVAALGFGRPAKVMALRRSIADGAPYPPAS